MFPLKHTTPPVTLITPVAVNKLDHAVDPCSLPTPPRSDTQTSSMNLTDALLHLRSQTDDQATLFTGSSHLNSVLGPRGTSGVSRGSVTEISGPPGSGRTAIALDLTADAIKRGHRVLWLTTSDTVLPLARLSDFAGFEHKTLRLLSHISISSLAQVLVLFKNPPPYMPPRDTALVVIDDLSALILSAYPAPSRQDGKTRLKEIANRRTRAMSALFGSMATFASTHSLAVVALGGMISQHSFTRGVSFLVPSFGEGPWTKKITSRVVLYKDILPYMDAPPPPQQQQDAINSYIFRGAADLQDEDKYDWYRQIQVQASSTAVHHAARISAGDELDPAILHKSAVALFDVTPQGIRNFEPPGHVEPRKSVGREDVQLERAMELIESLKDVSMPAQEKEEGAGAGDAEKAAEEDMEQSYEDSVSGTKHYPEDGDGDFVLPDAKRTKLILENVDDTTDAEPEQSQSSEDPEYVSEVSPSQSTTPRPLI